MEEVEGTKEVMEENEAEVKELAAQVQQAQDEKSELEMQISVLQKELIQQADKHSHQMKLIIQVC